MQAYVSLWSADLLDVGRAIDLLSEVADGFHLDVFDGHDVDDLLFGPDFTAAVRRRTTKPIDVHLNVTDPDHWVERFADVGVDMVTVQSARCSDVAATLARIRDRGMRASLGIEVHEDVQIASPLLPAVDRVLLMGTPSASRASASIPAPRSASASSGQSPSPGTRLVRRRRRSTSTAASARTRCRSWPTPAQTG